MLSLKELCVRIIYQHSLYSSLYILPVELVDQVFLMLAKMTALADSHLPHWKHTQVREFDFTSCKFITDHGIKEFVQRFSSMEALKLGESGITSQSISYIASYCTSIKTLDISEVVIKESDFNSLKKCTSLRHLICKKNSGLKAKGIGKLLPYWPDLKILDISGIEYGEAIFANIPVVKHLTHLYCASFARNNNKASMESIQFILDNCPSLISLDITDYVVNICSLRSTSLQSLDISGTVIEIDGSPDTFISHIHESFPKLESLKMEKLGSMKGLGLAKLATNKTLRELDFSGCISMDSGCVERWGTAASTPYPYTLLSLSGCKDISDASFSIFAASLSPNLHTLNLSGVWKLDSSIQVVAANCPHLTSIDLSMCKIMSSDSISALAKSCPYLKRLELYSCKNVNDDAIIALADNCPELTLLNLYGLPLTDRSVAYFGEKLHNLTSLDCSCTHITDESLRSIGAGCPLSHFSVIGSQKVSDHGVIQLVRGCLYLQRLVLNDCKQITDASLYEMATRLQFLRDLSVLGCTLVSGEGFLALGKKCRTLRTLRLSSGTPITTSQIRALSVLVPHLSLKL